MIVKLKNENLNFLRRFALALTGFMRSFKNPERELFNETENIFSITKRARLNNFISSHSKDSKDIGVKYTKLYEEYSKRYKINLPKLAQRSPSRTTAEYAEYLDTTQKTEHISKLYTLAVELFGDQASDLRETFYRPQDEV